MRYRKSNRWDERKELIAFIEKCYQLYEQKMYQAAYYIVQDSGWAEDAVQDAFLKLMKGRVYFEDACSIFFCVPLSISLFPQHLIHTACICIP